MYEPTPPFDSGLLDTGDGHLVYWEQRGNPDGRPLLVVHGGPGSGASPWWATFPDPDRYRIVLVDQRGCGRSTPSAAETSAALRHNTTAHLVADFERLRAQLGVERWVLFGGSWGSTLSLAYAVEHPDRVAAMVLWALVTTRRHEVDWLTRAMGELYPDEFDALVSVVPAAERDDNLVLALNRMLVSGDPDVEHRAALAWCDWEDRIATLTGPVVRSSRFESPAFRLGFARLVTHYFGHAAFLPDDGILARLSRIAHVPAVLVRGRLDIAAPLRSAREVAQRLPLATLHVVEGEAHGGADETDGILIDALDRFAGPGSGGPSTEMA